MQAWGGPQSPPPQDPWEGTPYAANPWGGREWYPRDYPDPPPGLIQDEEGNVVARWQPGGILQFIAPVDPRTPNTRWGEAPDDWRSLPVGLPRDYLEARRWAALDYGGLRSMEDELRRQSFAGLFYGPPVRNISPMARDAGVPGPEPEEEPPPPGPPGTNTPPPATTPLNRGGNRAQVKALVLSALEEAHRAGFADGYGGGWCVSPCRSR